MRRGEIWTASTRQGYAGNPRPVVIIQDDRFDGTDSITFCPLTTDTTAIPLLRILLQPNATNGLTTPSSIMADKITTAHRSKLGEHIGKMSAVTYFPRFEGLSVTEFPILAVT